MSRRNENIFEEKSHLGRKIGVTLLVVLLLTFGAGAVANFAISNTVKALRQTVTIPDLPNSLDQWSILLLTDLNGEYRGLNQASIGKAVGTRAVSCVIMTGNMIGENGDAAPALALLEQLPAGSKVLFLPGSGDPSPYATTAHASLSPYADWAQALIDAGVTMLDVPVSFTREKSTIWFVPEDLYTLNIPSARKAYQKQLDGLNALPTLTADQAALQRLAVYQLDRLDRIEAAMAEMTNKDMQVCVSRNAADAGVHHHREAERRSESRLRDEQCGLDCHGRLLRRAVAHSGHGCVVCAGTGLVSGGQSGAGTKLLWRNLAVC